jgi:hypothetical protein
VVWTEQLEQNELAPFKLFESKTMDAGDTTDPILPGAADGHRGRSLAPCVLPSDPTA